MKSRVQILKQPLHLEVSDRNKRQEAMDISDYKGILIDKIQKFEPECAEKIIERFLIDIGKQEMAMLASHHDHFIREVVLKAKMDLQNLAPNPDMAPISPPVNPQQGLSHSSIISPNWLPGYGVPSPYWDQHSVNKTNPEYMAMSSLDSITRLKQQAELLSLENQTDSVNTETGGIAHGYFGLDASAASFGVKAGQSLPSMSGFPVKACHYFNKGFCRHGTSCRYYHGQVSESFPQIYENGAIIEDQMYSLGSLAQLETEIVELIKSKRGSPLTIAKLPTAYQDKYNRLLQFDGYLTESQRHGKSGYNLTKLLARLKNSIRLILRPNGQHAVVLAEDAPKYIQKGDFGQNISASRQIYLTFPAESTFTEEDVSNYFNTTFGTVEDVRIPCQQRRMFGFVTFVDPETVKTILDKGNPHYVSGSRVLVKPYREKAKVVDRKFPDRIDHPVYHSPHYVVMDSEFPSISRTRGNHSFITSEQELEKAFDLKRRTALAELQFGRNDLSVSPQFGFSMDGSRASDDASNFKPLGSFSFALIEKPKPTDSNPSDENSSQGLNLQDSPFAFPRASGI